MVYTYKIANFFITRYLTHLLYSDEKIQIGHCLWKVLDE